MGFLRLFLNFSILLLVFYKEKHRFLKENQVEFIDSNVNKFVTKSASYLNDFQKNYLKNIYFDFQKTQKNKIKICDLGNDHLFTKGELEKFDGSNADKKLYLSFLGIVYDVSKGEKHYGPGGSYAVFTGKDASRAYITGDFSEKGLIDDLTGLEKENLSGVQEWSEFYKTTYKRIGRLIGSFYDESGCPTQQVKILSDILAENVKQEEEDEADYNLFPPCNIEWNDQKNEIRYYCSTKSGGIERDWVGIPRRYFKNNNENFRCVCVRNSGEKTKTSVVYENEDIKEEIKSSNVGDLNHPYIKEFENCSPESIECILRQ